ncbi:OLC1v1025166C1 [Oldenlandia corymbosa var. corymbosa]|uniref:OLC1v1025166C1 n=1 Tax=Oldenlandia corymbosa var. corymbosa TaxID=529605 RepID=A0AAV1C745_OLDCO|nr:OLC1v1025166C1 [Oldenlandia corymbosa var. corymbosa]
MDSEQDGDELGMENSTAISNISIALPISPPKPRKRARQKKTDIASQTTKKRGRPRKTDIVPNVPAPKTKLGRPRKTAARCLGEDDMVDSEGEKLRKQQSGADLVGLELGFKPQTKDANQDVLEHCDSGDEKRRKCSTAKSDMGSAESIGNVTEAPMDLFVHLISPEEELKGDGSSLNRTEFDDQPTILFSEEETGARNLSSGEKINHAVTDAITVSHENFGPKIDHGTIKKLTTDCGKSENEVVVNEGACRSDFFDSHDNREKLLPDTQVVLNAMKHATDTDIPLQGTDYQQRNENCLKRGEERNKEVMHLESSYGSPNVEDRKKEVMNLEDMSWRLVHCNNEDEENEGGFKPKFGSSHEVQFEKEDNLIEDTAAMLECKARVGATLDMCCQEKNNELEGKANEAVSEAKVGVSFDVQRGKEVEIHVKKVDYGMENKANEAACQINMGGSLEVHYEEDDFAMENKMICTKRTKTVMENNATEAAFEVIGDSLDLHCEKEDHVLEDMATEAAPEPKIGSIFNLQSEENTDVKHDKGNEAARESNIGDSLEVQNNKDHYVMENKATEDACQFHMGGSPEVQCEKQDDVMHDKANETLCQTNFGALLEVQYEEDDQVMEKKANEAAYNSDKCNSLDFHRGKEDYMMELKAAEAASEPNIGESKDLHHDKEDCVIENKAIEAASESNIGDSLDLHCEKEDLVLEDKETEAASEAKIGCLFDLQSGQSIGVMHDMGNEAASEAYIGDPLEVQYKKDDYVMENKANEAVCQTNMGSLEVQCVKQDDVMHDEANETACDANFGASLEQERRALRNVQDQHELELQFKGGSDKSGESLTDFGCNGMDTQEVALSIVADNDGKEVVSNASLDLLMTQEAPTDSLHIEGSADVGFNGVGVLDRQEMIILPGHLGPCHERNGKKPILDGSGVEDEHAVDEVVNISDKLSAMEMDRGGRELRSMQCDAEDKLQTLVNESVSEANPGDLLDSKEKVLHKPKNDSVHVPETKRHGKGLPNQNIIGTGVSAGHFASRTDMNVKLASVNCNDPMKRKVFCPEDCHFGHGAETKRTLDKGDGYANESMDLDFCIEQVKLWMTRLKNAVQVKDRANQEINPMLLRKVEEQSLRIEQFRAQRQAEQLQKQKDDSKYKRELWLMQNVLRDYRKSLKEGQESFNRYRESCQLPEGYMPHPSGGGRVMTVAEWNKIVQKYQEDAIRAMMKNFEDECFGKLKERLGL